MELEGWRVAARYDVTKKLQSGYYGTTWLARDQAVDEDVCLKTFFAESSSQRRELDILRSLSDGHFRHDNLCQVLDVAVDRRPVTSPTGDVLCSLHYVVFEYCSGSDLFNFLVTGPFERDKKPMAFPEPLARHYFTQALLATMYLHERGVFHRDIKPENCVLDKHFNLKLTDFGTNKILPMNEPGQILRTATKGIGTDSYRAPEVNGIHGYDPSSADVWSLGVTLFFITGIDVMVECAQRMDPFVRQVTAPLGILFPFPLLCPKLDSYMKPEEALRSAMQQTEGGALPNYHFWFEWLDLQKRFSPELVNLFNKVFVMLPVLRASLREVARHPWLAGQPALSPLQIRHHMEARCPSSVQPSPHAAPQALSQRLLGGVDQAALRQSLSRSGAEDAVPEYLSDAELWLYGDTLRNLEALQLTIVNTDLQEMMMDVSFARQQLGAILASPQNPHARNVLVSAVPAHWVQQLLAILGFLPQGKFLFLPEDMMSLVLLQCGVAMLEGLEMAVSRSAIPMATSPSPPEHEDMDHMISDHSEEAFDGSVTFSRFQRNLSGSAEQLSTLPPASPTFPLPISPAQLQPSTFKPSSLPGSFAAIATACVDSEFQAPRTTLASPLTTSPGPGPPFIASLPLPLAPSQENSQDSTAWTAYTIGTLSQQSSQESCPEAMVEGEAGDYTDCHELLALPTTVNPSQPSQFRAAKEFCKLSGLLGSFGLYQVVCHEQLVLYCRGNTASFSARLVAVDREGTIGVSSWCFAGVAEWRVILDRLTKDMLTVHHH